MTHQQPNGKSILILEDDVRQADALEARLRKSGYQSVTKTYLGIKALELATKQRPDIVLLDINLSGQPIDGIEVGRKIMQLDDNTIIIFLTAFGDEHLFKKALGAKPYAFIDKPYQMRRLNREIEIGIQKVMKERRLLSNEPITKPDSQQNTKSRVLYFSDFLMIKEGIDGHEIIKLSDIILIKGANSYSELFLSENKKECISNYYLKTFDHHFSQEKNTGDHYNCFVRVHRSYIINLEYVTKINLKEQEGEITLKHIGIIKVSNQQYVKDFWEAMHLWKK